MKQSYKYHIDRFTMIFSVIIIALFAVGVYLLYKWYIGGFVSAWFASIIIALVLLMLLSIPRRIVITESTLEIRCISDITLIPIDEIESIRVIPRKRMRWVKPLIGVVGFFGYYGKFIDLKRFRIVTLYASEWNNFVEIKDIYGFRTYLSCREADTLISSVEEIRHSTQKAESSDEDVS